jgi:hypothetical protein
VEQLGEMIRWDLITVSGMVPGLSGLVEAASDPLAEAFNPRELRDFRGRWERGGGHHHYAFSLLTPSRQQSVDRQRAPRALAARVPSGPARKRTPNASFARYEGGVVRPSAASRNSPSM